jgi:hypothetical protein
MNDQERAAVAGIGGLRGGRVPDNGNPGKLLESAWAGASEVMLPHAQAAQQHPRQEATSAVD